MSCVKSSTSTSAESNPDDGPRTSLSASTSLSNLFILGMLIVGKADVVAVMEMVDEGMMMDVRVDDGL